MSIPEDSQEISSVDEYGLKNSMTVEEILSAIDVIQEGNEILALENEVFERHLSIVRPDLHEAISEQLKNLKHKYTRVSSDSDSEEDKFSQTERERKLPDNYKCDIMQKAIDDIKEESKNLIENSERKIRKLKSSIEEIQIGLNEMEKFKDIFETQIVQGAIEPITGKIIAEKYKKFHKDYQRTRNNLIDKLRMRNAVLKQQLSQLCKHKKQREEMGEHLQAIDFERLKVESEQYQQILQDKNHELLVNKVKSGNAARILATEKINLKKALEDHENALNLINNRKEFLRITEHDQIQTENEIAKRQKTHKSLTDVLENYHVPTVLQYMALKKEKKDLEKEKKKLESKLKIAMFKREQHKNLWKNTK